MNVLEGWADVFVAEIAGNDMSLSGRFGGSLPVAEKLAYKGVEVKEVLDE